MKTDHTAGPWKVFKPSKHEATECGDFPYSIRSGDYSIAIGGRQGSETWNNAQLLAAAPDLLEAMQSLMNMEGPARLGCEFGAFKGLDWKYHFDKARAAIAKTQA